MIFQSVYFLNVKFFRSLVQMAENRTMGSTVDNGRAGVSCVSKCLSWCGRRSLVGCRAWGREESDTTERLPFHFSLSCIGEGNGNPLQCSCLENPRDGEPGGLPSMGSHRVRHNWSDLAVAAADIKITALLEPQMKTFPYRSTTTCPCVGVLSLHVYFPLYLKELCLSKISEICPCFLRSGLLACAC